MAGWVPVDLLSPRLLRLVVAGALLLPLLLALPLDALERRLLPGSLERARRRPAWLRGLRRLVAALTTWLVILLAQLLAITGVFLWANKTYGFYASWDDLLGRTSQDVVTAPIEEAHPLPGKPVHRVRISPNNPHPGGRLVTLQVPGADSGFGQVQVWLPPQYFEHSQQRTRFPVLLAMDAEHGTGTGFAGRIKGAQLNMRAISQGKANPFIAVYAGSRIRTEVDSECVDLPNGLPGQRWFADTLVQEVARHFRTVAPGKGWYAMGYSTGGSCAGILVARHPQVFTAAVSMAGYYTPVFDDPSLVAGRPDLVQQNSLLWLARNHKLRQLRLLSIMSTTDPQSWGDGGTTREQGQVMGDGQLFEPAAREIPGVAFMLLPTGGHNPAVYWPHWGDAIDWLGLQGL